MLAEDQGHFEKSVDKEEVIEQIDPLFDLISEKKDYLEARMERDQLTFGPDFTINTSLIVEILSYIFFVCYTIYEEVLK